MNIIILSGALLVVIGFFSLIIGLIIMSADEARGALEINDGTGTVTCLNSVLIGKSTAVRLGVYGGGCTLQNNDIIAEDVCVRCTRKDGQAAPTGLLYMCGNAFEGDVLLEDGGFPWLLDKNLFNGQTDE